jgi:hypothetical protein
MAIERRRDQRNELPFLFAIALCTKQPEKALSELWLKLILLLVGRNVCTEKRVPGHGEGHGRLG